ncbi:hypothetical protein [Actinomadura madurae]|uniref:hypothetical protein n=1 Tax=Actinomadura madurae TaxID=1993 RepID=UPI0020D25DE7|nr:hypothetical protein [Actinomadura madurae]MCP9951418.1 hypothetical protein [Actinomadura madurae]MCP9980647.1 hypothetical protein [Actinomadura madurae]MCQ0007838.1 hypothetical protein [Actinomadura madurae]
MTLLTAAATHTAHPSGAWLLLAILAAAGYLLHCVIWPYRACRKCSGAGRFRSPSGRAWRYCNRCGGRGAQLRVGRRIWTHLKNIDRNRR